MPEPAADPSAPPSVVTSSVTSVSWIPSEAVPGVMKLPFSLGVTHYDAPLPPVLDDLAAWRDADMFRFANRLSARATFDAQGRVVSAEHLGHGVIGATTLRIAGGSATFAAVPLPDLQPPPEIGDGWVRFIQTTGGHTGAPMPRTVSRPPYVQLRAPTVWTTLSLTLHADGRVEHSMPGASPFPRHWVYDEAGELVAKSGITDYSTWSKDCFGDHSPWGDVDSPTLVIAAETALERELSRTIMRGGTRPRISTVEAGDVLVTQGDAGTDVHLLLDGVLEVQVDGAVLAEVGAGAVVGERAALEDGVRTSTLRARTRCRVATAAGQDLDLDRLAELSSGHRREEQLTE